MTETPTLPLQSGSIVLRRLDESDIPAFLAYRQDPDVARYQSWGETTEATARRLVDHMNKADIPTAGDWSQIAVAEPDGTLLGDMGLFLSADGAEAEMGITLSKSAQGTGVAAEAVRAAQRFLFSLPGLERIVAIADKRNAAAIKCMAATGFRFTHEADFEEQDGTITPEVHYELLRSAGG